MMMRDVDEKEGTVLAGRFRLETGDGPAHLRARFSGPLADVFRARDLQSGREVALKRFRPMISSEPRFAIRFREQLKKVAGLRHAALVAILDYGLDGDRFYIASEWVEGVNLSTYLAEYGALSAPVAVYVARQICAALTTIHGAGVVHRGLKPESVYVTTDGSIKVADAGLSLLASESGLSRTTVMLGAVQTMSPEQARGQSTDARSDIYSLGVILFEMLTDRLPFEASDSWAVVRMHAQDPPPSILALNPEAPPALAEIVEKALQKAPEERFATAEALDAALAPLPQNDGLLWLVAPQHAKGLQGEPGGGLRHRLDDLGGWVEGLRDLAERLGIGLSRLRDGKRVQDGGMAGEQTGDRRPVFRRLGVLAGRLSGKLRPEALAAIVTWPVASMMQGDRRPALAPLLFMQFVVTFAVALLFFFLLSSVVIGSVGGQAEAPDVRNPGDAASAAIHKTLPVGVATPTLAPTAVIVEPSPEPAATATSVPAPAVGGATTGNGAGSGQNGGGGPPPHAGPPGGPPGLSGDKPGRGRGRP